MGASSNYQICIHLHRSVKLLLITNFVVWFFLSLDVNCTGTVVYESREEINQ